MLEGGWDLPRLRFRSPRGRRGQECQVLGRPCSLSAVLALLTSTAGGPAREMGLNCEHLHSMQTLSDNEKGRPVRSGRC